MKVMRTLISLRPYFLTLFGVGAVAVFAILPTDFERFFLLLFVASYVGMLGFLVTEAFAFTPPQRSKMNIWLARELLVPTLLIVAYLGGYSILTGLIIQDAP